MNIFLKGACEMIRKSFKRIGNISLALLIVLAIASGFSILKSNKNPYEVPSIFGFMGLTVLSGSMEPQLKPGDLVVMKSSNPKKVKVNDVITYQNSSNILVTHRIVDLVNEGEKVLFQTKGDANNVEDLGLVSSEDIIGSYLFHIPKAGYIANFIKSPQGIIVILIVSGLILVSGRLKKSLAYPEK